MTYTLEVSMAVGLGPDKKPSDPLATYAEGKSMDRDHNVTAHFVWGTVLGARPTITRIANRTTVNGGRVGPLSFTIAEADAPLESLVLSATSSSTSLLLASAIVLAGSGPNRTVSLGPVVNADGSTTVTITREGSQYLTVQDRETGRRIRLRGGFYDRSQ